MPERSKDSSTTPSSGLESDVSSFLSRVAMVAFFLTGFLSLTYEICWIRKASLSFGATTFAISTVIAVFFAGLSIGSYCFGRMANRIRRPLVAYGWLEVGVGVSAVLSTWAFLVGDHIYATFYTDVANQFWKLAILRAALVACIILPPTVLMGGTLPLFCRQFVAEKRRMTRTIGWLYAVNTLGAAVGCLVCGLFFIRHVGVELTIFLAAIINIILGIVVVRLARNTAAPVAENDDISTSDSNTSVRATIVQALFFLVGFVAIGNEVLWSRFLTLVIHNTVYTYTLTLAAMLLGIVLGSLIASSTFDRLQRRAMVFGLVQLATSLVVLATLLAPTTWWLWIANTNSLTSQIGFILIVFLPPSILSGMSFPLAIRMATSDVSTVSNRVGVMSAMNTIGGVLGSLLVGFLLLPRLGLHGTLLTTTVVGLAVGLVAIFYLEASTSFVQKLATVCVAVILWLGVTFFSGTELPVKFLGDRDQVVEYREGVSSFMTVVRKGHDVELEIDRMWQGAQRKTQQIMAAHVPMLMHPGAKDVAVVGLGTGQTARRFLFYPIESLDCIEIEAELPALVAAHFQDGEAIHRDKRTRFIATDGRNHLANTDKKYDVISIEVGQTFRPGISSLYTAEFYRATKQSLRSGGLVSQFLPLAFLDTFELQTLIGTFMSEFPNSYLWYNSRELLLIGVDNADWQFSLKHFASAIAQKEIADDLAYSHWGGREVHLNQPNTFLGSLLAGPEQLRTISRAASIYHDHHPWLEFSVAEPHSPDVILKNAHFLEQHLLDPTTVLPKRDFDRIDHTIVIDMQRANLRDLVASYHVKRALKHLDRGATNLAHEELARASKLLRGRVNTWVVRGRTFHQAGNPTDAIKSYRRAVSLDPNRADVYNNLSFLELVERDFEQSLSDADKALAIEPDFVMALCNRSSALLSLNRADEALKPLQHAIRLQPGFAQAHYLLGNTYAIQGDFKNAARAFQQAVELSPTTAIYHERFARALSQIGEHERAKKHFKLGDQLSD